MLWGLLLSVLVLIAGMIDTCAWGKAKARAQRINCVSNLKQISTALQEFAKDHDGQFPKEVVLAKEKVISHPDVMTYYQMLLPYNSRKVFVCPADDRVAAKEEKPLLESNVSYFFAGMPMCNDGKLLSGDRNLVLNGQLFPSGSEITIRKMDRVGFSEKIHRDCGNVGLDDGSVQQVTSNKLNEIVRFVPQEQTLSLP